MVMGFFSKERKLKRASKRALNKLGQQADRFSALEYLLDDGSEESLLTLLKRFTFTSSKLVEDQQEKDWVVESLTAKATAPVKKENADGDAHADKPTAKAAIMTALAQFLGSSTALSYPLRLLGNIASKDEALGVVDRLLADEPPEYSNDPKRKIDIINWLADYESASDDDIATRVAPYLGDFDNDCRFAAVEAIALHPSPSAASALLDALLNENEESSRTKTRIAEVLAAGELDLGDRKKQVSELFDGDLKDFRLHRNKLVRKK